MVDGCEKHYGDRVESPARETSAACKAPTVFELPWRAEERTVQDELDAHVVAWNVGMYSGNIQTGPCPLCPKESAQGVRIAQSFLRDSPPTHFFLAMERPLDPSLNVVEVDRRAPTPSPCVTLQDENYRLCAVIYWSTQKHCFLCQALHGGCWHTYDSCSCGNTNHRHEYATNPFEDAKAEPVFYAYFREDEYEDGSDDYGEDFSDLDCEEQTDRLLRWKREAICLEEGQASTEAFVKEMKQESARDGAAAH